MRLTEADEALWRRIQPLFKATPFEPPWVRDVARGLKVDEDRVRTLMKRVTTLGETYEVVKDRFFTRAAMTQLTEIAAELAATHGAVRDAEFRDRIGSGRKLAIQILEYFDKTGFSRRVGDDHRLRDLTLLAGSARKMHYGRDSHPGGAT